jgi:hypothetical protein
MANLSSPLRRSTAPPLINESKQGEGPPTKDICIKIFIVVTVFLAAAVIVTGILALMAVKGIYPSGMEFIAKLGVIGEINSYMMACGGIALLILGIFAWSCQLRKENQEHLPA